MGGYLQDAAVWPADPQTGDARRGCQEGSQETTPSICPGHSEFWGGFVFDSQWVQSLAVCVLI